VGDIKVLGGDDYPVDLETQEDAPVSKIRWVPIEKVRPNDYNPNQVAKPELRLLYTSIKHDGYTQPCVVVERRIYKMIAPFGVIALEYSAKDNAELWNYLEGRLRQRSPTPLAPLRGMAVLASIDEQIDMQSESLKEKRITGRNGASDSSELGALVLSKAIKLGSAVADSEIRSCGIGMSPDSIRQSFFLVAFCPTCLSSEKKHWKHWNTFVAEPTESTKGFGMVLKCNCSESNGHSEAIKSLPINLVGVSMLSGQEGSPSVCGAVEKDSTYILVDGFHRYHIMQTYKDIYDRYHGRLPVVVLDKDIKDRMASTVRHNRARGKHSVGGMGILVIQLSEKGWQDEAICNELGIEPDEMLRLKHTSGIAELYKNREFGRSWEEVQTIRDRKEITGG
jgi:hypothetical protein